MSKKLVITVEYGDGRPCKSTEPMEPEEVAGAMRDLTFRLASSTQFLAIYITRADCLQFIPGNRNENQA